MRVAVFGLGYVGSVTAACLASRGHRVVGVDVNQERVAALQRGVPPVLELGLPELIEAGLSSGSLSATHNAVSAVTQSDVSLVCVGTPSAANGSLGTDALDRVLRTIGGALPGLETRHTVVVRSTVLPGTTEGLVIPTLEQHSGLRAGADFGVAVNPEFLREGSSVQDFNSPSRTVVGELEPESGSPVLALYDGLSGSRFRVSLRTAEMAKYVDNAFHAVKVAFANEIGNVCRGADIDSFDVMEVFKADDKLNISTAYLTPGFAFGGSCLPKDLRALVYAARRMDLALPLLESVLPSNALQVQRALELIQESGARRVGLFGLAFKPGTDDLRESPLVELSERLLGKGFELKIFDPHISPLRLVGSNRDYIDEHIPHLSRVLVETPEEAVSHAEIYVIGSYHAETAAALDAAESKPVLDLVRLPDAPARRGKAGYSSVTW